jgi:hypothetical protein
MPEVNKEALFKERIEVVLDELSLGIRWDRPSLILAIYRSEHIKKAVQSHLVNSLKGLGQAIFHYSVDESHYDIPIDLMNHPAHGRAVYFVTGLRWGGGRGYSNAYRALNMHREYFVEANIRAIFWLSKYEAKQCSRFAPDFWAFRHKVVEFPELPPRNKKTRTDPSSGSIHNLYTREGIDFQERMEAAGQFYALGSIDDAILNYRKTLRKYPGQTAINLQIAEIYLAMGRVTTAKRLLAKAARGNVKRGGFLRELTRLTQTANTIKPRHGGLYEIEVRE